MDLPPGFRFHPTDEELITHYLSEKVLDGNFQASAISEVDLNKCEPWNLPCGAKMDDKYWYFFCVKDRKYPTGLRTNRATEAGYWKATGKDKEVLREKVLVGMKKTLVFYKGRAPKGEKTNWIMHEYRLEGKNSLYNIPITAKNEWVICRIFEKVSGGTKPSSSGLMGPNSMGNQLDDSLLPPLIDSCSNYYKNPIGADNTHVACFSNLINDPNQNLPNFTNLQYPESNSLQDQSVYRYLPQRWNTGRETTSYSEETCMSTETSSGLSNYGMGGIQSYEDEIIDLDCLWN
ncbi:hypothetical protein GIB67_007345 [Kingdonia uniflora]|uniref:NAC domain-containing protein n=1 Tax=Kingdonia uniflora TaxID=39325 RepID=A0A7J7NY09_9MAGN|nr:hypothetical protein GIB67_007345 [Kingdonia uniflora]